MRSCFQIPSLALRVCLSKLGIGFRMPSYRHTLGLSTFTPNVLSHRSLLGCQGGSLRGLSLEVRPTRHPQYEYSTVQGAVSARAPGTSHTCKHTGDSYTPR